MGFINERKNILRAEDGPLVAVDKNGKEVQIGNGSIACDVLKCGETVNFKFVDIDLALDALMSGSSSYFTASLIVDEEGGSPIQVELYGNYRSGQFSNPEKPSFVINNIAVSGLVTPPEEQAGGVTYPVKALTNEAVDSVSGYESSQFALDVTFFQIKYAYERETLGGATPSFQYIHNIDFTDNFDFFQGRIMVMVDTEEQMTGEVITGFTYSFQEPQYIEVTP